MLVTLTILALSSILLPGCSQQHDPDLETEFKTWMAKYSKEYANMEEFGERLELFKSNKIMIMEENRKMQGHQLALNQFADMSQSEFKSKVLMPKRRASSFPPERYAQRVDIRDVDLPDSFDWREKGIVTPVKDQGTVGTCWAFSTIENIESQWAKAGHTLTSLSVEQLVDCDNTVDPKNMHADCGVFGGWPYLAYDYIKTMGGLESEQDYPYCSGTGKCYPCATSKYNKTRCGPPTPYCRKNDSCDARLDSMKFVPGLRVLDWVAIRGEETEMMSQLVTRGPLSILINAEFLQFYHSGVWSPPKFLCGNDTDHAVLLVGYGTEKVLFGEKPYWLVKNSWGMKWGMDGYFKLERGKGICGVETGVTSAVVS
ncbi:procathepsin L-like [Corticium candelabrum]|uniref:procathepsin L-like n=1 Tax=Corticium candelabrum TaxID=121492 RepID=UPI002E27409E|nr:procathepsin L-like [Corticium candelabrum]